MRLKPSVRDLITVGCVIIGSLLCAININTFINAGGLFPGGFTGLTVFIQRCAEKYIRWNFTGCRLGHRLTRECQQRRNGFHRHVDFTKDQSASLELYPGYECRNACGCRISVRMECCAVFHNLSVLLHTGYQFCAYPLQADDAVHRHQQSGYRD